MSPIRMDHPCYEGNAYFGYEQAQPACLPVLSHVWMFLQYLQGIHIIGFDCAIVSCTLLS